MPYDYELLDDSKTSSPLGTIAEEDDDYGEISGASPLSKLMVERAKKISPRREDIVSRRDMLLNAYKNLIAAQQHKQIPVRDPDMFFGTSAALADSEDGGMRMLGKMQLGRAQSMLGNQKLESEALKNQALTQLKMDSENLGFLDEDQANELDLLKGAAANDHQQQMLQMKLLLSAMRNSKDNAAATSASPETFSALGVPRYEGPDPYAGLDSVGRRQMRMSYEKQLGKDQDKVADMQGAIERMKRFQQLNELTKDNVLGPGPATDMLPNWSDEMKEMESIAAEMTPQMRVPGSGASSDFDAKMFQRATVGTGKRYDVNKNVAQAYITSRENEMAKTDFMEAYLSANGHTRGAQQAWKKYLNDNPIFNPKSKEFELNSSRKTWQEYFGSTSPAKTEEGAGTAESEVGAVDLIPAPPQGYDPEKWKKVYGKMTPEQKKLFGGK